MALFSVAYCSGRYRSYCSLPPPALLLSPMACTPLWLSSAPFFHPDTVRIFQENLLTYQSYPVWSGSYLPAYFRPYTLLHSIWKTNHPPGQFPHKQLPHPHQNPLYIAHPLHGCRTHAQPVSWHPGHFQLFLPVQSPIRSLRFLTGSFYLIRLPLPYDQKWPAHAFSGFLLPEESLSLLLPLFPEVHHNLPVSVLTAPALHLLKYSE